MRTRILIASFNRWQQSLPPPQCTLNAHQFQQFQFQPSPPFHPPTAGLATPIKVEPRPTSDHPIPEDATIESEGAPTCCSAEGSDGTHATGRVKEPDELVQSVGVDEEKEEGHAQVLCCVCMDDALGELAATAAVTCSAGHTLCGEVICKR